ncbi:MAG TPA: 2TM domain-containing protein [Methanothermococcus okinawensis]|nr:2TM domain-containing protein [Methanothermococcus okinawensis]
MTKEMSLEEYKKAYREVRKERERKGFIIHLVVYLLANTVMAIYNLVYTPQHLWFFWPLIFWGFGLLCHYLSALRLLEKELEKDEMLAEIRAREGV